MHIVCTGYIWKMVCSNDSRILAPQEIAEHSLHCYGQKKLSGRERDFLYNIAHWAGQPSSKQKEWLRAIFDRLVPTEVMNEEVVWKLPW